MNVLFTCISRLIFYFDSFKTIHSPFIFKFYNEVIKNNKPTSEVTVIENLKNTLLKSKKYITVKDFGAGSSVFKTSKREISKLVKIVSVSKRKGQILYRITQFIKPKNTLELGTSLGFSSLYIAMADSKNKITTIEGCPETLTLAKENFKKLNVKNIHTVCENFDEFLPKYINSIDTLDLVFFDGNHAYKPTKRYFELCLKKINQQSIFIFDDIYWSKDMQKSWQYIIQHPKSVACINLFSLGIVFFNSEITPCLHKIRSSI